MHKDTYNINVACFCNQNFINAMDELKSHFGFNMFSHYKSFKDFDNSDNITPSGGPEEEIKDDDNTDDVDSKFKKPNAKGFGALKRDGKIKKNYEKVSEEFIDTKSALVRDKDLGSGEVVPFNRKMIINRIEDTFGRTDLTFEDKVMDGKEVIVISRKVITE